MKVNVFQGNRNDKYLSDSGGAESGMFGATKFEFGADGVPNSLAVFFVVYTE